MGLPPWAAIQDANQSGGSPGVEAGASRVTLSPVYVAASSIDAGQAERVRPSNRPAYGGGSRVSSRHRGATASPASISTSGGRSVVTARWTGRAFSILATTGAA